MSTATGHVHDPSALARRYRFLGFPGERRERSLSYAELRAELGDDKASALVVRIGALAQLHHLDQSHLGLSEAVAKILQSLTPDERRSIAQGNAIPPRIEAMVSAEAEAAKTAAQAEAARHNASGAPLSAMAMAALGFGGGFGRYAQNSGGTASDAGGGGSSAKYDSVAAGAINDWGSSAGQRYMSNYAIEHGVPWAANNPELLKLGPSAIDTLRDVHLRQDVYNRMIKEAKFKAKDIVRIMEDAKRRGADGNEVGSAITDAVRGMSEEDRKVYCEAVTRLANSRKPNVKPEEQEAANNNYNEVTKRIKGHVGPEHGKRIDKATDALGHSVEENKKAEADADKKVGQANKKVDATNATLTALNRAAEVSPKGRAANSTPERPAPKPTEGPKAPVKYGGSPHPAG